MKKIIYNIAKRSDCVEALKQEEYYTIDDIYNLPDRERAELIDGKIYYMSPPGRTHQRLVSRLNQKIANYIEENCGKCEVFPAPFAVFLNKYDTTYVEPDISVICDPSKLDEKGCHGAPDWVIEIVSKSSRSMDCFTKLFKYRNSGVREYWIVDPTKEIVMVYQFEKEIMEQYGFGEEVKSGIYDDFVVKI